MKRTAVKIFDLYRGEDRDITQEDVDRLLIIERGYGELRHFLQGLMLDDRERMTERLEEMSKTKAAQGRRRFRPNRTHTTEAAA